MLQLEGEQKTKETHSLMLRESKKERMKNKITTAKKSHGIPRGLKKQHNKSQWKKRRTAAEIDNNNVYHCIEE